MSRKESEAVPVVNGPVPQQEEFRPDQPTLKEVCRIIKEVFESVGQENRQYARIYGGMEKYKSAFNTLRV